MHLLFQLFFFLLSFSFFLVLFYTTHTNCVVLLVLSFFIKLSMRYSSGCYFLSARRLNISHKNMIFWIFSRFFILWRIVIYDCFKCIFQIWYINRLNSVVWFCGSTLKIVNPIGKRRSFFFRQTVLKTYEARSIEINSLCFSGIFDLSIGIDLDHL